MTAGNRKDGAEASFPSRNFFHFLELVSGKSNGRSCHLLIYE